MKNIKFVIGCTKTMQFTTDQVAKIKKGIEIFNKVVASKDFEKKICNFTWTTPTGNTYSRFHVSRGLSNKQVWNCLMNGTVCWNSKMKTNTEWKVMPCRSQTDIMNCTVNPTYAMPMTGKMTSMTTVNNIPCIWVNTNCMTDDNYTPVHIASAMMHEYCVNLGFGCHWNGQMVRNWNCTVPYACAQMMMECCKSVCSKDTKVKKWMKNINMMDFNYCPTSATFFFEGWETGWNSACAQIDAVICSLEMEYDCLNHLSKRNAAEKNRYSVIKNTLKTLRMCKEELTSCCLDGCETVGSVTMTSNYALAN